MLLDGLEDSEDGMSCLSSSSDSVETLDAEVAVVDVERGDDGGVEFNSAAGASPDNVWGVLRVVSRTDSREGRTALLVKADLRW